MGCRRSEIFKTLEDASQLLVEYPDSLNRKSNPDSALEILCSIDPDLIDDDRAKATLGLLLTEAMYKGDYAIPTDSSIDSSYQYFLQNGSPLNKLKSAFYLGVVRLDLEQKESAIIAAQEAHELAMRIKNPYWIARSSQLLGDLFMSTFNSKLAMESYKETVYNLKKCGRIRDAYFATCDMAAALDGMGFHRESLCLLDSVCKFALNSPVDSLLASYCVESMIGVHDLNGEILKSDSCFKEIEKYKAFSSYNTELCFRRARAAIFNNRLDEAKRYIDSIEYKATCGRDTAMALWCKASLFEVQGDYKSALAATDSSLDYQNRMMNEITLQSVVTAQRDYYDRQAEAERAKKERLAWILAISVIAALIILGAGWWFYRMRVRIKQLEINRKQLEIDNAALEIQNKNLELDKNANDIMRMSSALDDKIGENLHLSESLEQKKSEITEIANRLNASLSDIESMRTELTGRDERIGEMSKQITDAEECRMTMKTTISSLFRSRLDFFNKIAASYVEKKDTPAMKKALVSDLDKMMRDMAKSMKSSELEKLVNVYMDNIIADLREKCATMTEDEIQFTVMVYAGFMPKYICEVCGFSYKYYYTKRERVEKKIKGTLGDDDGNRYIGPLKK